MNKNRIYEIMKGLRNLNPKQYIIRFENGEPYLYYIQRFPLSRVKKVTKYNSKGEIEKETTI